MKTIHLILNSHIDPVWLWRWPAGVDVVLNTCRSACDIMEEQPDLIFTCGEAWKYDRIEQLDPDLFARIRHLVDEGRWELVGGWWIQSDCNLPSGNGLRKQIALGKEYFLRSFSRFPATAYNVDSFGHAATLPQLMREAGQSSYIMMRPQEHEMRLPARLFRWRTPGTATEVTTFRIAGGYAGYGADGTPTLEHFTMSLENLPDGIDDTMCFVGVGDHGGGPTRRAIEWCRDHADAIEGARLVFSSPSRFFTAVAGQHDRLPIHEGELQHHAIGCYSVMRKIKASLRRAEDTLALAETVADSAQLSAAWKRVCFNHFHDILAGSSIPSACEDARNQLGAAISVGEELLHNHLRGLRPQLGKDKHERVVLRNPASKPFSGYVAYVPFANGRSLLPGEWRLVDEQGRPVPHQIMQSEAAVTSALTTCLLFPVSAEPGQMRTLRLMPGAAVDVTGIAEVRDEALVNSHVGISLSSLHLGASKCALPRLELLEDATDTWSHGIDRYAPEAVAVGTFGTPLFPDRGPLLSSRIRYGYIGQSRVCEEYRVLANQPWIELLLTIDWSQEHQVLKLVFEPPASIVDHIDGIPAGQLLRLPDGRELPLQDFTALRLAGGATLGISCPDIYALDVTPERVRFTLLRSPLMAHHEPMLARDQHRRNYSDRGQHTFRFTFGLVDENLAPLPQIVTAQHHPLLIMEMTEGMPR